MARVESIARDVDLAALIPAGGDLLASVTVHEQSGDFEEDVAKLLDLEVRVSDHENYKA